MRTNKIYSRTAFTLIEVLLALSLVALIGTLVYTVFWQGMRLSQRADGNQQLYREIVMGMELINKELENAVSYDFSNSYPEQRAFVGDDRQISFILPSADGLRRVRYYLVSPDSSKIHRLKIGRVHKKNVTVRMEESSEEATNVLIRESMSFIDSLETPSSSKSDIEILATHIKKNGLRFTYAYPFDEDFSQMLWKEQWNAGSPPRLIRIKMDFIPAANSGKKRFTRGTTSLVSFNREVFIPHGKLEEEDEAETQDFGG